MRLIFCANFPICESLVDSLLNKICTFAVLNFFKYLYILVGNKMSFKKLKTVSNILIWLLKLKVKFKKNYLKKSVRLIFCAQLYVRWKQQLCRLQHLIQHIHNIINLQCVTVAPGLGEIQHQAPYSNEKNGFCCRPMQEPLSTMYN